MRKFPGLLIAAFAMILSLASCGEFDDIWSAINRNSSEIAALKEQCNRLNSDVADLRQLVSALAADDYITYCFALSDGTGYTLVFKSGKTVVIECGVSGQDGKDGKDGQDGHTPHVGVAQDADGNWYWTLDGEWLLDDSGNKVKANGTDGKDGSDGTDAPVPMFKIENGMWNISIDGGATWTELGKATGEDGKDGQDGDASFFKDVIVGAESITFILVDGSFITLPFNSAEKDNPAITGESTNVEDETAEVVCWCKLEGTEGLSVLFGIEYSATDLTTDATRIFIDEKDGEGKFAYHFTGLKGETKYYYRAFAYLNGDYYYGDVKTFTTKKMHCVDAKTYQIIAEQDESVIYRLTGYVSGFDIRYCSFYVDDSYGMLYVYVDEATQAEYTYKLGYNDKVTIEGQYRYYAPKSQHQIYNAKITAWTPYPEDFEEIGWFSLKNTSEVDVVANGFSYEGITIGSDDAPGEAVIGFREGTSAITFCCVAWDGEDGVVVEGLDSDGETVIARMTAVPNAGAKGDSPYTLTVSDSDYHKITRYGAECFHLRTTGPGRVIFFDFRVDR